MQGGCGLGYAPERNPQADNAGAPVYFPDGFDGHGYIA